MPVGIEKAQAKPVQVKTPRAKRAIPAATLGCEPGFRALTPCIGSDLLVDWGLPTSAYDEGRVRVQRRKVVNGMQTGEVEILRVDLVRDYNLSTLAALYGPGDYYLYLSPSPQALWTMHHCKVSVSPQFAADAGWGKVGAPVQEMPRINDIRTFDMMAKALEPGRPVTMGEMGTFVETIVEQTVKRLQPMQTPVTAAPPGMEQVVGLWQTLTTIQNDARKEALAMLKAAQGANSGEDGEEKDIFSTIIGEGMKALPELVKLFTQPRQEFAPQPSQPAGPPQPTLGDADPQTQEAFAMLSQDELTRLGSTLNVLKQYGPLLLNMLKGTPIVKAVAQDVAKWIPPAMERDIIELAELVATRGPALLAIIHPGLVTPAAAELITELAAILKDLEPLDDLPGEAGTHKT
jgi:hypothetical protein